MLAFATEPIPHDEAVKLIADKPLVTKEVFDQLPQDLKARAFTITGIEDFDVLQAVRDRIAEIPAGANWDEVKKDVVDQLSPWLSPEAAESRAKLLMRHHAFSAYAATQAKEMDELADIFPYRQYISTGDAKVRPSHAAINGIILPATHKFWEKHTPPWEFNCRCDVVELTEQDRDEEEFRDKKRPVDQRRILKGSALKKLEKDNQLVRGVDNIVDLRTAKEKGGNYELNVRNLTLPYNDIKKRWDTKTQDDFENWASGTQLEGSENSLLGWLTGKPRKSTTFKEVGKADEKQIATLLEGGSVSYGDPSLVESMSATAKSALLLEESSIRKKSIEHGMLYESDGTQTWSGKGLSEQVKLPSSLNAGGKIFTHNHPGGSSFSYEDVEQLMARRLAEVRAVTRHGTFSISRRKGVGFGKIIDAATAYEKDLESTLKKLEKEYSKDELHRMENHLLWSKLAKDNLINYQYQPMRPDQAIPDSLSATDLNLEEDTRSDEEKEKNPQWDGYTFITRHPKNYVDGKDPGRAETIARYRKRQAEGKPAFYD